jgi:hypothetical protein
MRAGPAGPQMKSSDERRRDAGPQVIHKEDGVPTKKSVFDRAFPEEQHHYRMLDGEDERFAAFAKEDR